MITETFFPHSAASLYCESSLCRRPFFFVRYKRGNCALIICGLFVKVNFFQTKWKLAKKNEGVGASCTPPSLPPSPEHYLWSGQPEGEESAPGSQTEEPPATLSLWLPAFTPAPSLHYPRLQKKKKKSEEKTSI